MFEVVSTPLQTSFPTSNAVRAGRLILTTQIPRDPETHEVLVGDDIVGQVRRCFENLRLALEASGGDLKDVMQMTVYLTDVEHGVAMNQVYNEMFSAPFPSRATVVVKALMLPGLLVEVTAQAWLDSHVV